MKYILIVFPLLLAILGYSQPNTEVYLLDLTKTKDGLQFSNLRNISNNPGYDNQPSFWDNQILLFSSARNSQTDILEYDTHTGSVAWLTDTPQGSEYSPLRIPKTEAISTIRLDTTGYQRLYQYNFSQGSAEELLEDRKVGYQLWYDENTLATTVLVASRMDLMISLPQKGQHTIYGENVGRSLQKIPNTPYISYISKAKTPWEIRSLDPQTGLTQKIGEVLDNSEDICWLNDGTLLTAVESSLYQLDPKTQLGWIKIQDFGRDKIANSSRLAVNPRETLMALVGQDPIEAIVDRQASAFNSKDLNTFTNCFAEAVLVRDFPNDTLYTGRDKLMENYGQFMQNEPEAQLNVINRIKIGNVVIDEEMAAQQGKQIRIVTIYEIKDGKIASLTSIHGHEEHPDALNPVKQQLLAYNARDINAFLKPYSATVGVYNFSNDLRYRGLEKMRKGYGEFFKNTPDLYCDLQNRISIGNRVIDEEKVTANGKTIHAVAIYTVLKGKIIDVTFVR